MFLEGQPKTTEPTAHFLGRPLFIRAGGTEFTPWLLATGKTPAAFAVHCLCAVWGEAEGRKTRGAMGSFGFFLESPSDP